MNRSRTKIDACVIGHWVEEIDSTLSMRVEFKAESLVFDNQWVELYNPLMFRRYTTHPDERPFTETINGWFRVPVRRIKRLTYDLCVA